MSENSSKEQQNHKSHYDDDQIHARVFRSLKMGHRLPLFVKFDQVQLLYLPGEGLIQNHHQQYFHNAPYTT